MKTRAILAGILATIAATAYGQAQRNRIDVQDYAIEAQIDPRAGTINATARVRFTAVDDVANLSMELNNSLALDRVLDENGAQVNASRTRDDMAVRIGLNQPVTRGKSSTLTFFYGGKLTGDEESPVFGIKFAAIKPDVSYLMYPARWFPVNDYTADRFAADIKVTVPAGYQVIGSGISTNETAPAGAVSTRVQYANASFPGSIAIVHDEARKTSAGGVNTTFYMRTTGDMASAYGEEIGRAMGYFTDVYGRPPSRDLTVIETEPGTPNGYSAPGIIFMSPSGIGKEVNPRLVANMVARQWIGGVVSPTTRNHMWIENGLARYSEFLYLESINGAASVEPLIRDTFIEALTADQAPLIQAGRLEDYSPEYWAATAGKGAAVVAMLRTVIGEENFKKVLHGLTEKFAYKSVNTDDVRKLAEDVHGSGLNYFFLQWIESSGAPEFKMEYTIFRTQKGFRVIGKITQDLDTFRMPATIKIETEGNPEEQTIEVVGTSSEFVIETFGKPKTVTLDAKGNILHFDNAMRVAVAIKRGEQFAQVSEFNDALREYQKALDVARNSSLAHYRVGEVYLLQGNNQQAANAFRDALAGDLEPKWTEVWSHINLGKIFDITDQRDRAVNEYRQALRTKDNTQGALEEAQKYIDHKYERQRRTD